MTVSLSTPGLGGSTGPTDKAALRANGTGGFTAQGSALIIDDTTGRISRSGNGGIQQQGTNTNSSPAAGDVGELIECTSNGNVSATVTMTIASPGVVTWNSHGLSINAPVVFTTTGALPTGITSGNTYYVISAGYGTNTFQVSTSIGGSAVNTSGSQSGTHTATNWMSMPNGSFTNVGAINLTAGDWDVTGTVVYMGAATTTLTYVVTSVCQTSSTQDTFHGRRTDIYFNNITAFAQNNQLGTPVIPSQFSLSGSATIYVVGLAAFGVSTVNAFGTIRARRMS